MADIIHINEDEGKKRVMGNGKLYTRLLTKFKTDINLNDFMTHAEAEDWQNAQNAIHTIKGTAANLSLIELFKQSLEVETLIKDKSLKNESLEKLKACFAETLVQVDRVIAKNA